MSPPYARARFLVAVLGVFPGAACGGVSTSASASDSRDAAAIDATATYPTPDAGPCSNEPDGGTDGGCGYAQVATDPHNCGQCGHDCDGGACQSGVCGPLASNVLATGQHCSPTTLSPAPTATGLTVTSQGIYWTAEYDDQLQSCPLGGGAGSPSLFATNLGGPHGITHDDSNVYWVDENGTVWECPLGGCGDAGPTSLVNNSPSAGLTAVDAQNLYWVSTSPVAQSGAPAADGGMNPLDEYVVALPT